MKAEPQTRDICASDAGYQKHLREKERPCDPCRSAHNLRQHRNWQKRTGQLKANSAIGASEELKRILTLPQTLRGEVKCSGETDKLFPVDGNWTPARRLCNDCMMKSECRDIGVQQVLFGMAPEGMFGGLTPKQLQSEANKHLEDADFSGRDMFDTISRLEGLLAIGIELSKDAYGSHHFVTHAFRELFRDIAGVTYSPESYLESRNNETR